MDALAGKSRIDLPSTTRGETPRTSQAFGDGSVLLLTDNAEDGEIVYSHMKVWGIVDLLNIRGIYDQKRTIRNFNTRVENNF